VNANRPTRATTDGRAYLDLQNLARHDHRPTDEYVQFYALEGMLARLISSDHAEKIVIAVERATANTRWRDFADPAITGDAKDKSWDAATSIWQ
jgi:hypothetical protein